MLLAQGHSLWGPHTNCSLILCETSNAYKHWKHILHRACGILSHEFFICTRYKTHKPRSYPRMVVCMISYANKNGTLKSFGYIFTHRNFTNSVKMEWKICKNCSLVFWRNKISQTWILSSACSIPAWWFIGGYFTIVEWKHGNDELLQKNQ